MKESRKNFGILRDVVHAHQNLEESNRTKRLADPLDLGDLFSRYKEAESHESILLGHAVGEIKKGEIDTLLQILFNSEYASADVQIDNRRLEFLGSLLYKYKKGAELYQQLDVQDLQALSLAIKFLEEFFYSKRFLEFIKNNPNLVENFTFLVNMLAKIKETRIYTSRLTSFDHQRQDALIEDVVDFVEDSIQCEIDKVSASPLDHTEKLLRTTYLKHIGSLFFDSVQNFFNNWKNFSATDIYLVKDCLIAACAKNGLLDFVPGYRNQEQSAQYITAGSFDFRTGSFVPAQDDARKSLVHYKKETMLFAAFVVEFFRSKMQSSQVESSQNTDE